MIVAQRKPLDIIIPMLLGLVLLACARGEENKPARAIQPSGVIPQTAILPVDSAAMMVEGKLAAQPPSAAVVKDAFGPGENGVPMYGNADYSNELRYACKDVPEGDYYPGLTLAVPWGTYFGLGEVTASQLAI